MARNAPIRTWDVHDVYSRPLRLYRPTKSCPYLSATWYEPGDDQQQRTTLGNDQADALRWCGDKAQRLCRAQRRARPERPRAPGQALVDEYLNLDNQPGWESPATYSKNRALTKVFLPPRLLAMPCEQWRTEDLRNIILSASKGPHKRSYIVTVRGMLSGLVRVGVDLEYLDPDQINIASVRVPRATGRSAGGRFDNLDDADGSDDLLSYVDRRHLPSIDRIHALADGLPEPYRTMVLLAGYSGMRWGELAALRYTEVDQATRIVRVDRAALEDSGGKMHVRRPKNRRRRITLYPALIAPDLASVCAEAQGRADHGGSDLLFPSAKGTILRRSNFGNRYLRPAKQQAGWRDTWTFHSLRHCAAVWMLYDQRFDLHDVADVLGHRDVSVTQRIYVQAREGVAERLAALAG